MDTEPKMDTPSSLREPASSPASACVDGMQAAPDYKIKSSILTVKCPSCRGPVFAPSDSDRERVDCFGCAIKLVTRRGLDGLEIVPAREDAP